MIIKKGFMSPSFIRPPIQMAALLERAKETTPDGFIVKPLEDNDLRVAIELALGKK